MDATHSAAMAKKGAMQLHMIGSALGTNQTKIAAGRLVANHGNKGRPFRLALPRAHYCDNSAER